MYGIILLQEKSIRNSQLIYRVNENNCFFTVMLECDYIKYSYITFLKMLVFRFLFKFLFTKATIVFRNVLFQSQKKKTYFT